MLALGPREGVAQPGPMWVPEVRGAVPLTQRGCQPSVGADPVPSRPLGAQAADNPAAASLFAQRLRALRDQDGFGAVLFSSHVRKVRAGRGGRGGGPAQRGGHRAAGCHGP